MAKAKLAPIKSGIVIDHIGAHDSLRILKNLGIGSGYEGVVGLLMNVPSKKLNRKDVIKIEDAVFTDAEVYKVAAIASYATISYIKNYKVDKKVHIETLDEIVLACSNIDCKSNFPGKHEFTPRFKRNPDGSYACKYCGRGSC
jgi:aspartate carbamoyltransferase regulatory subunit